MNGGDETMKKRLFGFLLVLTLLGILPNTVMAKTTISILGGSSATMYKLESMKMSLCINDGKYAIIDYNDIKYVTSGVTWTSSNTKIATVNKKSGLVKAKKEGKCTITGKYRGHNYKCKVTVKKPYINYKNWEMGIGEEMCLKLNDGASNGYFDVKWSSSAPSICSVKKDGQIKAKKVGTCYITAKYYTMKFKCKVVVKKTTDISTYLHNKDIKGLKQIVPRLKTKSKSGYSSYMCRKSTDSAGYEGLVDFEAGIPNDGKTDFKVSTSYKGVTLYGIKPGMSYQAICNKLNKLSFEPNGGQIIKTYYITWYGTRFCCEDFEFYLHGNGVKPDEVFTCSFTDKILDEYEWRIGNFD